MTVELKENSKKEFIEALRKDNPCLFLKENSNELTIDKLTDIVIECLHFIKSTEILMNVKQAEFQSQIAKRLEEIWT